MLVRDLISGLGGPCAVAAALSLSPSAITNWSARNDVPRAHHLQIWRMALENDVAWEPPGARELCGLLAQAAAETQAVAA